MIPNNSMGNWFASVKNTADQAMIAKSKEQQRKRTVAKLISATNRSLNCWVSNMVSSSNTFDYSSKLLNLTFVCDTLRESISSCTEYFVAGNSILCGSHSRSDVSTLFLLAFGYHCLIGCNSYTCNQSLIEFLGIKYGVLLKYCRLLLQITEPHICL